MLTVWVSGWQVADTVGRFSIGLRVTWALLEEHGFGFSSSVLGSELARAVTHRMVAYGDPQEEVLAATGTVRSIRAASCAYAEPPGSHDLHPVEGTLSLVEKRRVDGWEREGDGQHFVAYLVELDVETGRGGWLRRRVGRRTRA